jgi:hypothetical protein
LDFGGKFGPPEADEVKKCAKTYVKKAKNLQICAQSYTKDTWQGAKRTQIYFHGHRESGCWASIDAWVGCKGFSGLEGDSVFYTISQLEHTFGF